MNAPATPAHESFGPEVERHIAAIADAREALDEAIAECIERLEAYANEAQR